MRFSLILMVLTLSLSVYGRTHLIYSVSQDIPMGWENEVLRKNFYLNLGENQGVKSGTTLNVYRIVSRQNPYDNGKRTNHRVKIGEVEVIHSEDESSIAVTKKLLVMKAKTPLDSIASYMIGDHVEINVE